MSAAAKLLRCSAERSGPGRARVATATLAAAMLAAGSSAQATGCAEAPELTASPPDGPGLVCAWQQPLDQPPGTAVDDEGRLIFGPAGERSRFAGVQPDGTNAMRVFVDAAPGLPDERAIAVEVPPAPLSVPSWELRSRHFEGEQVTHAGFAVEMFLPGSFRFPERCAGGAHSPGQGRWPWGLWIGGWGSAMANGVLLDQQTGVSVRFNRSGGVEPVDGSPPGQAAAMGLYVYNLNRARDRCGPDAPKNVCSTNCAPADGTSRGGACANPDRPCCYGFYDGGAQQPFPRDRWVRVSMEVKLNDPGKTNGTVRTFLDGVPLHLHAGVLDLGGGGNPANPGQGDAWFIKGFYGFQMWHCQPAVDAAPYPRQTWWFRNLRLYRGS